LRNVTSSRVIRFNHDPFRAGHFRQPKTVPAEIEFHEPQIFEKIVSVAKKLDPRAYLLVLSGTALLRRAAYARGPFAPGAVHRVGLRWA
jgi:hypothetical protein